MKLDCKLMTGEIYNCPNLSECLEHSPLNRVDAMLLYYLNQGVKHEDLKIDEYFLSPNRNSSDLFLGRVPFVYNNDGETRDTIIFGVPLQWNEDWGGIKYFRNLTIARLQQLIDERFVDPTIAQNNSPTIQAFLEFTRSLASIGFEFAFEGYAVCPSRDDYRVSIDGIIFEGTYSAEVLEEFYQFVGDPDEIEVSYNHLRAWWD